jgi:hypothetical protein
VFEKLMALHLVKEFYAFCKSRGGQYCLQKSFTASVLYGIVESEAVLFLLNFQWIKAVEILIIPT